MMNWSWAGLAIAVALVACGGTNSAAIVDGGTSQPGSSSSGGGSGGGSGSGGSRDASSPGSSSGPDGSTPGPDGSAPSPGTDGGSAGATGVKIIVEPNGNKASELVAAINAATKYVHMTMYLMDDPSIINALVSKSKAGVDVKVILNDFSLKPTSGDNTVVYNHLKSGGLGANVILSNPSEFNYTHEKCVVIDGTTAWIMTMNLNKGSPQYNREYLAVDSEAADVAEAEAIFQADFTGVQGFAASGSLVVAPQPPNNSRTLLVALIDSATKTLDLEDEEFSDTYSTGITNAVAAAAKRGVKVRVIVANSTPTSAESASIATVKSAGASVVISGGTAGASTASSPFIHGKAITVDCSGTTCAKGWVGSENMTGGSLGYNRELGVIIANATELAKVETAINTDFAAGTPQ